MNRIDEILHTTTTASSTKKTRTTTSDLPLGSHCSTNITLDEGVEVEMFQRFSLCHRLRLVLICLRILRMLVFNIYIFKFKEVPETVSQVNVQRGQRNFPQKNAIVFETENSLTKISFVAATADAARDETALLLFVSLLCSKEVENASDAPL